jgi:aspartate/methionine/tyrosine aminotransferase
MPRYPEINPKLERIQGAVFEKYRHLMDTQADKLVRLHIGDTYLTPDYPLPINRDFLEKHTGYNRYCNTFGIDDLRTVLAEKLNTDNRLTVNPDNILITSGATNALSAAMQTILSREDSILVLTPCWPILPGIIASAEAEFIEVPVYMKLYENSDFSLQEQLNKHLKDNTCALYLNSPNNPSGKVLNREQLKEIAEFVRMNRLWLITDEAYEGLLFDGREHACIAGMGGVFDQTISVFTFSKIFMFAGLRLGYAVANPEMICNLNKTMVHQIYSPSTITQLMMIDPVITRHKWMTGVCHRYQDLRNVFHDHLNIPYNNPEATYFIFFDVSAFLNNISYEQLILRIFNEGVSVAPGADFGRDYENYIRICFTGENPERLKNAIDRLNNIFLNL